MIGAGTIGSSPVGVTISSSAFTEVVSESLDSSPLVDTLWGIVSANSTMSTDAQSFLRGYLVSEGVTSSEFPLTAYLRTISEELTASEDPEENLITINTTSEGVLVEALVTLVYLLLVSEDVDSDESLNITHAKVVSVVDAIYATSSATTIMEAIQLVAESISASVACGHGWGVDIAEALGVDITVDNRVNALMLAIDSIISQESITNTFRVNIIASEEVDLSDVTSVSAKLTELISEGVVVGGVLNLPSGSYDAWVTNSQTGGLWQYTNYNFNSFADTGSKYLGANENGIYELTGTDDDGTNIDASIKSGIMRFGTSLIKTCPRAYVGYTTDGRLLLKTYTTETGDKIERWYELETKNVDVPVNERIKLNRGVKSVYWQFEITNVDGADFDINSIQFYPLALKRRV